MTQAFWLVLVDLWYFFWGIEPRTKSATLVSRPRLAAIAPSVPPLALETHDSIVSENVARTLALPLSTEVTDVAVVGTRYVVVDAAGAALLQEPRVVFDTLLMWVPFGQSMTLRRFVGSYAEVLVCGKVGFIHKDAITAALDNVWPQFKPGTVYAPDAPTTVLVRQHIKDSFLGGLLCMPLTAGEYVTLRLLQDQLAIPWPSVRPRQLGSWHALLRGIRGVRSGVSPETDSLMEWVHEDGAGRVAYVEAVLPDQTLKLSAVGLVMEGEYTESIVPPMVWREWRPVFITIR